MPTPVLKSPTTYKVGCAVLVPVSRLAQSAAVPEHQSQHVTVLALEVLPASRDGKQPDPAADPILAVAVVVGRSH
jgi:hypothetical protein